MGELEDGVELPLPEEDSGGTEMPLGTTHDDDESDEDVDPDNPQWQLFLAAKNLTAPSGEDRLFYFILFLFLFYRWERERESESERQRENESEWERESESERES